jgi:hypothetical protein
MKMEEQIKKLSEYTQNIGTKQEKNSDMLKISIVFIVIAFLILLVFYVVESDAFKSNINQSVVCEVPNIPDCNCPNVTIPKCPDNTCIYNFSLPINFTIYNQLNETK